eukprot:9109643-Pyramimonas_sp.AAC.1
MYSDGFDFWAILQDFKAARETHKIAEVGRSEPRWVADGVPAGPCGPNIAKMPWDRSRYSMEG